MRVQNSVVQSGSRNSLLVRAPDSLSKGCEFKSRQKRRENFLLQSQLCVLTLIRCPFHPVLSQWHVKDPGHSVKSADGWLHLNMHTPLTQRSRSGLTMPLSSHCVGIYQETSSHATRQGTLSHSRLSSLSLIKKKKKAQAGNELSNVLPKFSHARKKPPPLPQPSLIHPVFIIGFSQA